MKFSTRSRYGLRFMTELAAREGCGRPVFLKEISSAQGISEKYLSKLVIPLKAAGLVVSERGANGGYRLGRQAVDIAALDIVKALEGDIAPVDCVKPGEKCVRAGVCPAKDMWMELDGVISGFLASKTLDVLAKKTIELREAESGMYYI